LRTRDPKTDIIDAIRFLRGGSCCTLAK